MAKIYKISLSCLILLIMLVVLTNVTKYVFTKEYDYIETQKVTTNDDIESFGIFIREEEIVENSQGNYVHIDITNGSRVKKDQVIGIIYNELKYLEQSLEISQLRNKLAVIDGVATITQTVSNSLKTAVQINEGIAELSQNLDPNNLSSVDYSLSEIETIALNGAYSQMSKAELLLEKEMIELEIAQKQAGISGAMEVVKASVPGNFVEMIDSYENISEVSVDIIREIVDEGNRNYANSTQIGKIITDNEWKFACVVDTADVESILSASRPKLIFESMPSNEIYVEISEVINEGEQSIIIFSGKTTNETLLEMRSSNVQIVLRSYTGLKIPKQAVVVYDNTIGVYVLSGSRVLFKEITPIFEKDNYYIIELNSMATSQDIIAGDRMIINSTSIVSK
ncbi:MAG: HlyD family efflux transporter periplasmic adaptor subunit [Clostridia bacterium]